MFKLYSKGCQYALRALAFVVTERGNERFQIAEVCEQLDIPESFTRKIFQDLVQAGFIQAHRGPGGGYSLTQPPDEISLLDVIQTVDGDDAYDHCIMGLQECTSNDPCPVHHLWVEAKATLLEKLDGETLNDIAELATKREKVHRARRGKN